MNIQTVTLKGQRYVILPEKDYRWLQSRAGEIGLPPLPPKDAHGNYPTIEAMRVTMARTIIRRRRAVGLTQVELARRAGVRQETLSRLEHGKHTASLPTIRKIEAALEATESEAE